MWTLTVNFANDALNAEMRDAFADLYNYTGFDPQGNPETKAAFRDRMVKRHCKNTVALYREKLDQEAKATRIQVVSD